ncbi:MAG TPA: DNA recombination protein RmuC [Casimicrobiaceae bacterium]|nr:DNA recombination protein RmuC [Casimicrobiaceae bacterium]
MTDGWSIFIALALCALVVLAAMTFARLARIGRERDAAGREAADLRARLESFAQASAQHERDMREDLAAARRDQADAAVALRREVGERLAQLTQGSEQRLEAVRTTVEQRLDVLRSESAQKLEQMRVTVDEKLQTTLDQRLGESFRLVSERLEQVHKGLGEMQTLAVGVGDLKRVLTNVKTRGTWGEVQLGALLAEVLTPQQYATNVETVPGSNKRIEYAIRLPGRADDNQPCWLPIDAKLPLDHWQRLQDALERADLPAADNARKSLADFLRQQARTVRASYVAPPHTTDFAVLFLPLESLYAEMMARPGLADGLQRDFRVMLTGPNNFIALLNIVQMGFRTLAIEQRSSEVWRTLGAVKTEFSKFGDVLAKIKERLDRASQEIENAGVRRRVLERHLRTVEALPEPETARLLGPELNLDLDLDAPPEEK